MKRQLLVCLLLLTSGYALFAQADAKKSGLLSITPEIVNAQFEFLASDYMEGRGTGERGGFMASDYIASMFRIYGLTPSGDRAFKKQADRTRWDVEPESYQTYFQNFDLVKYKPGQEQHLKLHSMGKEGLSTVILNYRTDYSVNIQSAGKEIQGPMVFVGYGIRDEESGWDDLKGTDLKGKIVVRIYGYPGRGDTLSKGFKAFGERVKDWETSPLSKRDEWIKDALAVIDIPENYDPQARWVRNDPDEEKPDFYEGDKKYNPYDGMMQLASDSLKREPLEISLSKRAWAVLNENSGIDIEAYKKAAAELKNQKPVEIPGKQIELRTTVESEIIRTRNVVGIIKGEDTTRCIVIGAHYDHIAPWEGMIFNGADDNASGTVAVMTLARAFMENGEKPAKTLVFAAWSAEEKGLIGSEYYVEHPVLPITQTDLYVNFDMISRNSPKDTLGTGYSFAYFKGLDQLKEITSKNNEEFSIGLNIRYRPGTGRSGGSDHVPFAKKDVPYMYSMAGFHTDYHTPFDEVYKCDINKMTKIIQLNYLDVWDALQWPARKN